MEGDINKFFSNSESGEILRSQIHPAEYNPRFLSPDAEKAITRSVKKFGVVGGIVINRQTDNTIVGGHQKVKVLDKLNKYDPKTGENDYTLRVEFVDVDLKTEKELNLTLNNPNVQGDWDFGMLRELLPDIDYKDAGFTEADLSMIGVDFLFQTDEQSDTADLLNDMRNPVDEDAREKRRLEREAKRLAGEDESEESEDEEESENGDETEEERAQRLKDLDKQAKIEHMKNVKAEVQKQAIEQAANMEAYIVVSFDTYKAKSEFCLRCGYPGDIKFIKGEDLENRVEVIIDEDEEQ